MWHAPEPPLPHTSPLPVHVNGDAPSPWLPPTAPASSGVPGAASASVLRGASPPLSPQGSWHGPQMPAVSSGDTAQGGDLGGPTHILLAGRPPLYGGSIMEC